MEDLKTMFITMAIVNCFSIIVTIFMYRKKQRELRSRSLMTDEPEEKEALLIVEKNILKGYIIGSVIFCVIWDIIIYLGYLTEQPGTGF